MKTFKEFLNEAEDVTIFTNLSATGASLVKSFTDVESDDILDALKSNPASRNKLEDFVYSASDEDEKYSETIVVRANGRQFTLYAANARLRIGGGGANASSKDRLMDISAKDLIKWLPSARIKSK